MALSALDVSNTQLNKQHLEESDVKENILKTHTEELIIGLCGPIGTDIHYVAREIQAVIMEKFHYKVVLITLSEFIRDIKKVDEKSYSGKYSYIEALITAGNELRKEKGNAVLAELAINEIAVQREKDRADQGGIFKSNRVCYIIDSIKNTEELELFRLVYTDLFYFIGVFSNMDVREKNLDTLAISKPDIHKLIDRDFGEELQFGQKVSDTFVQSDFFLRIEESTSAVIRQKIVRYLNLIFSSEVITPTYHETAMYQATAASGNSACLSRQVGAAITNRKGDILSVGWNDVPQFGGGVYTYSETDALGTADRRCINLQGGKCFNDSEKDIIRTLLVNQMISSGLIQEEKRDAAVELVKKSRIKELIEFSRAVHAEMHAIINASQKAGHEILEGNLYCTTYPCHNCARHIVASGIKDVYYIEPYRKSLALKLHSDSISENENDVKKVRILMFDGVAPRRYLEFFRMAPNSRKHDGRKKPVDKETVYPKNTISLQAIPILEKKITEDLKNKHLIPPS